MSIDVAAAVVIERPITDVAAWVGDPSNRPEWRRRIDHADWRTDPPTRLGSRIAFRTRWMGRARDEVYEIFEWTPGEQVAMRTTGGPFPRTTTSTWRPVGDRVTHMTLRSHIEPRGLARLLTPLVARRVRRAMDDDLADLKRLLEN